MGNTSKERLIAGRMRAIEARRAAIAEELEKLQLESDKLQIAKDVLASLVEGETETVEPELNGQSKVQPDPGSPRPKNIPTVREMATKVLMEAGKGMTGRDIVLQIEKKWWPQVGANHILPTLSRLARSKKYLKKQGHLYKVVENRENSDLFSEPSQRIGEG